MKRDQQWHPYIRNLNCSSLFTIFFSDLLTGKNTCVRKLWLRLNEARAVQFLKEPECNVCNLLESKLKVLRRERPARVCLWMVSSWLCSNLRICRLARCRKECVAMVWILLFPKCSTCKAVNSSKRPCSRRAMWLLERSRTNVKQG